MINSMAAQHAIWPKKGDVIFEIAGRAKEAIKIHGQEAVINSTIGALIDDDGKLICMNTVYKELKSLPNEKIAGYSALEGQPDFLEAVQTACFREYRPKSYTRATATPGGTGSIKHAVWNYTNMGDEILICDWYWAPYETITEEIGRKIRTYTLFNDTNEFNIESFKENFENLVVKQKRVLTIINTPAHNPTGYSLSNQEWDKVLDIMKNACKDEENKIILYVDAAYLDFAGEVFEKREFFTKFSDLPSNLFVIIGYSMSKGYTMYGLRSGAAIGISSNEEITEEFFYSCLHSGRATWSNGTRGAMEVMTAIANDPNKLMAYEEEKTKYKQMLIARGKAFVESAKQAELEMLPYKDGFFISIPHENPKALMEELVKHNLFAVSLKKGIRFAVCAVSEEKCKRAPAIIKKAMEAIK